MGKDIFINMEKEIFRGNLLDVGFKNYGVIYNLFKQYEDGDNVDYVSGKTEGHEIEKNNFDACVMLFSLSRIWSSISRKRIFKELYGYLKDDANIYIWDQDKGFSKIFNNKIKILLPDKNIREIEIKDFNILKDCSIDKTLKLMKDYFEIIDLKCSDNIYYIKGKKKGNK